MITECKTKVIKEGYEQVEVPEEIHAIYVLNEELEVDESTIDLGMVTVDKIAEIEKEILK